MKRTKKSGGAAVALLLLSCSQSKGDGSGPTTTIGSNTGSSTSSVGGATASGSDATNGNDTTATSMATDAGGSSGSNSGGTSGAGGAGGAGGATSDGASSSGGGEAGSGATGGVGSGCKRGIAANVAPGPEFFPAVSWWYNWAVQPSGGDTGIEFVPMIWGSQSAGDAIPVGSRFLLGFNEPNFFAQANLSAQQAADAWPEVESSADAQGVPVVSPAMNFCGPANECHDTDPYQYLKDFFAACDGCRVDYVAVHWYNCDLPSLRDYLEPGGGLEGFEQFGLPIWITEFSCDPSASVAEQEAYMREAIPYLESKAEVFRYAWFSAGPIPSAILINDDGSPTALGQVYLGLEQQSCD